MLLFSVVVLLLSACLFVLLLLSLLLFDDLFVSVCVLLMFSIFSPSWVFVGSWNFRSLAALACCLDSHRLFLVSVIRTCFSYSCSSSALAGAFDPRISSRICMKQSLRSPYVFSN